MTSRPQILTDGARAALGDSFPGQQLVRHEFSMRSKSVVHMTAIRKMRQEKEVLWKSVL